MQTLSNIATGFIGLFQEGGTTFVGWVTGIVPTLIMLLVAMNAIIRFVGSEKIEKLARASASNVFTRYLV
jgi:PTS system glucitol/sorbitol-specific IIC component